MRNTRNQYPRRPRFTQYSGTTFDVNVLKKMVKYYSKHIEGLSKYETGFSVKRRAEFARYRRQTLALIENNGLLDQNQDEPNLSLYGSFL